MPLIHAESTFLTPIPCSDLPCNIYLFLWSFLNPAFIVGLVNKCLCFESAGWRYFFLTNKTFPCVVKRKEDFARCRTEGGKNPLLSVGVGGVEPISAKAVTFLDNYRNLLESAEITPKNPNFFAFTPSFTVQTVLMISYWKLRMRKKGADNSATRKYLPKCCKLATKGIFAWKTLDNLFYCEKLENPPFSF